MAGGFYHCTGWQLDSTNKKEEKRMKTCVIKMNMDSIVYSYRAQSVWFIAVLFLCKEKNQNAKSKYSKDCHLYMIIPLNLLALRFL